jgi:hypothetical protein
MRSLLRILPVRFVMTERGKIAMRSCSAMAVIWRYIRVRLFLHSSAALLSPRLYRLLRCPIHSRGSMAVPEMHSRARNGSCELCEAQVLSAVEIHHYNSRASSAQTKQAHLSKHRRRNGPIYCVLSSSLNSRSAIKYSWNLLREHIVFRSPAGSLLVLRPTLPNAFFTISAELFPLSIQAGCVHTV